MDKEDIIIIIAKQIAKHKSEASREKVGANNRFRIDNFNAKINALVELLEIIEEEDPFDNTQIRRNT